MLKDLFNSESVKRIFNILKEAGSESRFIGGCVRDSICGVSTKDIDIATTCLPEKVETLLRKNNIRTINIGKDFGTVIAIIEDVSYEITTLRKDVEFYNGRHAVVEYSKDWREDAERRDFTFNAMSYCPYTNKLFDYFSGQKDLANGIVRFIGKAVDRVKEDYLRILRFFRFYAYYGHSLEQSSLDACIENAKNLSIISAERKWQELSKILSSKKYLETLDLMIKHDILSNVLDKEIVGSVVDILRTVQIYSDKYGHYIKSIFILFMLAYLSEIKVKNLKRILSLSNKESRYIATMYDCVDELRANDINKNLYSYIYKWKDFILDSLVLICAIDKKYAIEKAYSQIYDIINNHSMIFPVNGYDIMSVFSVNKDDKRIGVLLKKGQDYWCRHRFASTKDEVIGYLKKHEK